MQPLVWLTAVAVGAAIAVPPSSTLAQSQLAQTPTVPIGSLQYQAGIQISGTVGSVVGNDFTLSDSTGEVIVDAGPRWYQAVNVRPGERLTVVGEFDEGEFDAFTITRASGEVIVIRNGPGRPPWAGGPSQQGAGRPPLAGQD